MSSPPATAPVRRTLRVRHELQRREVEVVRVQARGPGFLAITFHAESLAGFRSDSFDDHVKFMLPDGAGAWLMRDYTPLRFDAARRELTLEFALHGHGPASDWARQGAAGQQAVIAGPRGSMIIPSDYAWHLLVGDGSALPAVERRLAELPAAARVLVLLQVADPADRRTLASAAQVELQWLDDDAALLDALAALPLPAGEGFVWCAGEAATMARARELLLQAKGHPKEAMKVAAYWKRGAADFHETLEG
jgi:NADPH-dependent ferric siderophore reductase